MSTGAARLSGRGRREAPDGGVVARRLCMVRQPGVVDAALTLERLQHCRVELPAQQRSERRLDGAARQFVAERQRDVVQLEDACGQAVVDRRRRRMNGFADEPQLGLTRHHRDELRHRSRLRRQVGQPHAQRSLHAPRHAVVRREHLGDEERIATRQGVQIGRVTSRAPRQSLHRGHRQWRRLDPCHVRSRQRLEHPPHVLTGGQRLRPARQHQTAASLGQPPRQQGDDVERGLIGPVKILDRDRRRSKRGELVQQRSQERLAPSAVLHRLRERSAGPTRDIVHRPQRPRDHQRVAGPPQHAHPVRGAEHAAHERRLADPGLAGHEHDPARRTRLGERLLEVCDVGLPLQQHHPHGRPARADIPPEAHPTGR